MADIVIIGGGPAGMSAALYSARSGLDTAIIENGAFGGQMTSTPTVENFPSVFSISGADLAFSMKDQIDKNGVKTIYANADKIIREKDYFVVTAGSKSITGKAVIIANGVRRRKLGVKGEDEFSGRGISWCAVCDGGFFKNRTTAVFGGGKAAFEDALYLSSVCKKVYLIHRRDFFRAPESIIEKVRSTENIEMLIGYNCVSINGDNTVSSVTIESLADKSQKTVDLDGVFEAVGLIPDNERFKDMVALDKNGYIIAGEDCKTSNSGIFAAGDTRTKTLRQIITATGDGAVAATNAFQHIKEQG